MTIKVFLKIMGLAFLEYVTLHIYIHEAYTDSKFMAMLRRTTC